ncbi:hypothetical protein [Asticcacaulis sp. AC402]|nr:hypothetical protein [Asticcacaulis sp. AC402]
MKKLIMAVAALAAVAGATLVVPAASANSTVCKKTTGCWPV